MTAGLFARTASRVIGGVTGGVPGGSPTAGVPGGLTAGVTGDMNVSGSAIRVGRRSALVLWLASLAGVVMFCWPLVAGVTPAPTQHAGDAPFMFMVVMPVLVLVVLAELSEGGMDSKALAMLGVLSAVNAALRPPGQDQQEEHRLDASRAGVGPWLPFQMMAAAWIGMGAGLLPRRVSGRREIALLVGYGIFVAYGFGLLMNLWYWPFVTGVQVGAGAAGLSFVPADQLLDNMQRFLVYTALTSTFGWDTGRAITNTVALLVLGPAVLATLRRAARRASYGAPVEFSPDRDDVRANA